MATTKLWKQQWQQGSKADRIIHEEGHRRCRGKYSDNDKTLTKTTRLQQRQQEAYNNDNKEMPPTTKRHQQQRRDVDNDNHNNDGGGNKTKSTEAKC